MQTLILQLRNLFPLPRLLLFINLLLGCLLIWLVGIAIARVIEDHFLKIPFRPIQVTPQAQRGQDRPLDFAAFQPIIQYNVFNAEVSRPVLQAPVEEATVVEGESLQQRIAGLQLIGVSLRPGEFQYSVIRDRSKNQEDLFGVGDTVFETGATVSRISVAKDQPQVHLKLGRETAVLTYLEEAVAQQPTPAPRAVQRPAARPEPAPAPAVTRSEYTTDGSNYHITSTEVDNHLNNFAQLLNQARMVPYFKGGQHQGYQVKAIDRGSLYEKMGLQNNDIIEEINGQPLDSMEKVMGLFQKLRNERAFTVKINRAGADRFQNYHIN
jgi:type II secretion system protein C